MFGFTAAPTVLLPWLKCGENEFPEFFPGLLPEEGFMPIVKAARDAIRTRSINIEVASFPLFVDSLRMVVMNTH